MNAINDALKSRLSDSFLGPLSLYFFAWNYSLIFYGFGDYSTDVKLLKIKSYLAGSINGGAPSVISILGVYAIPVFLTLFFTIVWPKCSLKLIQLIRRQTIDRDYFLNSEGIEGNKLYLEIISLRENVKSLENEVASLEIEIEKLQELSYTTLYSLLDITSNRTGLLSSIDNSAMKKITDSSEKLLKNYHNPHMKKLSRKIFNMNLQDTGTYKLLNDLARYYQS